VAGEPFFANSGDHDLDAGGEIVWFADPGCRFAL
jgi:hypothetical protein